MDILEKRLLAYIKELPRSLSKRIKKRNNLNEEGEDYLKIHFLI